MLQQLAQLVTASVQSVITFESSVIHETGQANTSFKALETSGIELEGDTRCGKSSLGFQFTRETIILRKAL